MLETILEAATRVLARESLAGFNTNRVAEVAGISVGSLYQYFPNKAALVAVLIERAQAALADSVEREIARLEGQDLRASLRALARLAVEQQFGHPVLAAALDHEEKRLPVDSIIASAEQRIVRATAVLLARHRAELAPDLAIAQAAVDCLVIAKALVEAKAASGAEPDAGLEQRVCRALYGYLTVPLARAGYSRG